MLCQRCNKPVSDESAYCPYCGNLLKGEEQIKSSAAQKALAMIRDQRFQYLCILYTVYAGLSIISGNINIVSVLMTIFLWLVHTSAKKGDLNSEYMKYVSGTLFAQFVVAIVAVVLIFIVAILFAAMWAPPMGMFVDGTVSLGDGFLYELASEMGGVPVIMSLLVALPVTALFAVLMVWLVVAMVLAILAVKNYHKFAKSLYMHIKDPFIRVENADGARKWLLINVVFQAVGLLLAIGTGILPIVSSLAYMAALYFGAKLIGEYFLDKN